MIMCVFKDALSESFVPTSLVPISIKNFTARPGILKDFLEVCLEICLLIFHTGQAIY